MLIRTDSAGATYGFAAACHEAGCGFSLGFAVEEPVREAILALPEKAWTPAYDIDGQPREGAGVAELTALLELGKWPQGSRVIVRRERPHPGAQLRFTDADGHRFTAFITDTKPGGPRRQHADLEVRHRAHARVEDRIRCAKATGLRNLPCKGYQQNKVWLELALTAADLLTWMQALCLDGELARCEPAALHYRLLHVAARLVRTARRWHLKIDRDWPWASDLATRSPDYAQPPGRLDRHRHPYRKRTSEKPADRQLHPAQPPPARTPRSLTSNVDQLPSRSGRSRLMR